MSDLTTTDPLAAAGLAIEDQVRAVAALEARRRSLALELALDVCEKVGQHGITLPFGPFLGLATEVIDETLARARAAALTVSKADPTFALSQITGVVESLSPKMVATILSHERIREQRRTNEANIISRSNGPLG